MVLKQILKILLATSFIWFYIAISAIAQEVNKQAQGKSVASVLRDSRSIREIPRLGEGEFFSTSAQELISPTAQAAPTSEVVQVTGVKANSTDKGVEVILQTSFGQQLQITNRSAGNNFIADKLMSI